MTKQIKKKNNITKRNITKRNTTKKMLDSVNKHKDETKYKSFELELSKEVKHNKNNSQTEDDLAKQFLKPFSPKGVKPNDDFYTFINYQWLSDVENGNYLKKKFYTQYDDFRIVQEKVYYDLIDTVKNYIKSEKGPLRNQLKNVFDSLSLTSKNDRKVEKQINNTISKIDKFIADDDLYGLLAYCNRNELVNFACPIAWSVKNDLYDPTTLRSHFTVTKLPYYDLDLYVIKDTDSISRKQYKTFFKNRYVNYCKELFDYIDPIKDRNYEWLFDCGREIYLTMSSTSVPESNNFYNVVKREDAHKYNFDWDKFTKSLGYKKTPEFFIVDNLSYLNTMMEILNKEWKTPKWREWFVYINIKQQIRFHEEYYKIYFKFYRKFVQGAEFKVPKTISPIFVLSLCFDKLLSSEYIKNFGIKEHIDYVTNLSTDLLHIYKIMIKNNTWLSPHTKKHALKKLEKLKIIIGCHDDLLDDPILNYTDDDVWENIEKIYKWRLDKYISLEGKSCQYDLNRVDWTDLKLVGRQCYIVNAFYTPQKNDIYIPLGYLQKPFLDLNERGIEYNLARIGFTISHELSHALDDTGSYYDCDGTFKDWWTAKDRMIYEKKIYEITNHYEAFAAHDDVDFDAVNSIGENLADITAVTICQQYLRDYQIKNTEVAPMRNLSFTTFFTHFAIQMRQSIAKKAYRVQKVTNPHPPDKYRVNVPLSRLKLFRSVYNVKKGDKMHWHNIDSIW